MHKTGKLGEDIAVEYLKLNGYQILERNWRGTKELRCPEIDIIVKKHDIIIFVEVKTSSTGKFGSPEHWITPKKQNRLTRGASVYLSRCCDNNTECRFDAITIDCQTRPPTINHIVNAFLASDIDVQ